MTRQQRDFICWLAGFVDGEGYIGIEHRKDSGGFRLRLAITQKDRKILEAIHQEFGGTVWDDEWTVKKYGDHWCYKIEWSARKAAKMLRLLLPYLRVKKGQAKLGLEFQALLKSGRRRTPEIQQAMENLANSVKALKRVIPSQTEETVHEVDDSEGVTTLYETREGR